MFSNLSIGLKVFLTYLIIGSGIAWYLIEQTPQELSKEIDKAAEDVMIDTANLLAQSVSEEVQKGQIDTKKLSKTIEAYLQRKLDAKIYDVDKEKTSLDVYIANNKGIVIYDSTNRYLGEDFSKDNDVYLTLKGQYGARASAYDRANLDPLPEEKAFYVAAPIYENQEILGVLTVVKKAEVLREFFASQKEQIKYYAVMIFIIAMLFGAGVSVLVSRSATKLIRYTTELSKGKKIDAPKIRQIEFSELAEAIKKLRIEVEEKEYVEEMISTMAHELRTPITGIRMNAENLYDTEDKEKKDRSIKNILDANNRMDLLINKILDLSRLELRDKLDKHEIVNIRELVNNVLKQFNRRANISKQKIHIREDIDESINVHGDKLLLEQALGNIIDNAVSFSPENANLDIELQSSNRHILLKVRDEGPGIPGYAEGKVFSRFYSTVKPDSGRRSNGLGLRFVKKIMELHKGEITLKNRIMKKGAEAVLKFPVIKKKNERQAS